MFEYKRLECKASNKRVILYISDYKVLVQIFEFVFIWRVQR